MKFIHSVIIAGAVSMATVAPVYAEAISIHVGQVGFEPTHTSHIQFFESQQLSRTQFQIQQQLISTEVQRVVSTEVYPTVDKYTFIACIKSDCECMPANPQALHGLSQDTPATQKPVNIFTLEEVGNVKLGVCGLGEPTVCHEQ